MRALIETMAHADFYLFLLSLLGPAFFRHIHKMLVKCDPNVFGYACVVIVYLLFETLR